MTRLTPLIVGATITAIVVPASDAAAGAPPGQTACNMTVTSGHVPGHLEPVWVLRCDAEPGEPFSVAADLSQILDDMLGAFWFEILTMPTAESSHSGPHCTELHPGDRRAFEQCAGASQPPRNRCRRMCT